MILLFRVAGVMSLTLAGILLSVSAAQWWAVDRSAGGLCDSASAVEMFKQGDGRAPSEVGTGSPLVRQAERFAAYLAPPAPASAPVPAVTLKRASLRRAATREPLRVHATSCYPDQPERSMALVSGPGSGQDDQRWVREGAELGPVVIHEIHRSEVVYREGGRLRRAVIDRGVRAPTLADDLRSTPHDVGVIARNMARSGFTPTDANSMEFTGN